MRPLKIALYNCVLAISLTALAALAQEEESICLKSSQNGLVKASVQKYGINPVNDTVIEDTLFVEKEKTPKNLKLGLGTNMKVKVKNIGPISVDSRVNAFNSSANLGVNLDLVRAYDMVKNHENPYQVFKLGISKAIVEGFDSVRSIPGTIGSAAGEVKDAFSIVEEETEL